MTREHQRSISMILSILILISMIPVADTGVSTITEVIDTSASSNSVIRIHNDTHLNEIASDRGWVGAGAKEDPYIMQGYNIDAKGRGSALHIGNTTLHLHVRDSTFHNASWKVGKWWTGAAITLYNTKNVTLQNNNCSDSRYGVLLDSSYHNRVEANIFKNNRYHGIDVSKGGHNIISGNTLLGKGGLFIDNSPNNIFYGNSFAEAGFHITGGRETYTEQTIHKNNTINDSPICYYANIDGEGLAVPSKTGQVILANVTDLIVEDLEIRLSNMIVAYSNSINIYQNTISRNPGRVGMHIVRSKDINIENNQLTSNQIGISITHSTEITIAGNVLRDNFQEGIFLDHSSDISVKENILDGCRIRLEDSSSNTITDNLIFKNAGVGIHIVSGRDNELYKNAMLYNNGAGDIYDPSKIQARDDPGLNKWNSTDGKGNYWSDLTGPDEDGNGIVDIPYPILGSDAYDLYPLTDPTMPVLPGKPQNLSLEIGNSQLLIRWKSPSRDGGSDILGHRIYRRNIKQDTEVYFTVNSEIEHYRDTNVTNGVQYSYRISAFNAVGEGLTTSSIYGEPDGIPPYLEIEYPKNNTYTVEQDIMVLWNHTDENSGVSHSEVRLDMGNWTGVGKNLSYVFYNIQEGKHRIYVRVFDNAGNKNTKWVSVNIDLTPPTVSRHEPVGYDVPVDFEITVEFSESMDVDSVNITIPGLSLSDIEWSENNSVASTRPIENATYGRTYHVFVEGRDIVGHSLGNYRWNFTTTDKGSLVGIVVDNKGEPISDVNVSVGSTYVHTDATGRFVMTISQGTHTVFFSKQGYEDRKMTVEIKAGEQIDMEDVILQPLSTRYDWILIIVSVSIVISGIMAFALFMIRLDKEEFSDIDEDYVDEDAEEVPPEFLE